MDNVLRKPYGPGWALVGGAGYDRDPITAQGISDAFRDAEACARALDDVFRGHRSFEDAMSRYQTTRDASVLPMYEFTTQMATLEPPPPEVASLLASAAGDPHAMDVFAGVVAGTVSPAEFFDPRSLGRIMSAVG